MKKWDGPSRSWPTPGSPVLLRPKKSSYHVPGVVIPTSSSIKRCGFRPLTGVVIAPKNEIPKSFPLVFGAFDAKSPSTPGEETTPGTPTLPPTPTALFPGTKTPCKGLSTTYLAGEDHKTESLGQRANEDDTKGLPGLERSSGWDPGQPTAENPSTKATDSELDHRPSAVMLCCNR